MRQPRSEPAKAQPTPPKPAWACLGWFKQAQGNQNRRASERQKKTTQKCRYQHTLDLLKCWPFMATPQSIVRYKKKNKNGWEGLNVRAGQIDKVQCGETLRIQKLIALDNLQPCVWFVPKSTLPQLHFRFVPLQFEIASSLL